MDAEPWVRVMEQEEEGALTLRIKRGKRERER